MVCSRLPGIQYYVKSLKLCGTRRPCVRALGAHTVVGQGTYWPSGNECLCLMKSVPRPILGTIISGDLRLYRPATNTARNNPQVE